MRQCSPLGLRTVRINVILNKIAMDEGRGQLALHLDFTGSILDIGSNVV